MRLIDWEKDEWIAREVGVDELMVLKWKRDIVNIRHLQSHTIDRSLLQQSSLTHIIESLLHRRRIYASIGRPCESSHKRLFNRRSDLKIQRNEDYDIIQGQPFTS